MQREQKQDARGEEHALICHSRATITAPSHEYRLLVLVKISDQIASLRQHLRTDGYSHVAVCIVGRGENTDPGAD